MIPNLYIENGCFTQHPFINGCLGFQVDVARSKFKDIVSKTNIQRSPALADWVAISGVWTPKRKRLSLENLIIAGSANGERIAIMGGRSWECPTFPCFFFQSFQIVWWKRWISRATRVLLVEKIEACTKSSTVAPPPSLWVWSLSECTYWWPMWSPPDIEEPRASVHEVRLRKICHQKAALCIIFGGRRGEETTGCPGRILRISLLRVALALWSWAWRVFLNIFVGGIYSTANHQCLRYFFFEKLR